jgi:hypothetical protein
VSCARDGKSHQAAMTTTDPVLSALEQHLANGSLAELGVARSAMRPALHIHPCYEGVTHVTFCMAVGW